MSGARAAGVAKAHTRLVLYISIFVCFIRRCVGRASLVLSTESGPGSVNPSRTGIPARCRRHAAASPHGARLPGKGGRLVISITFAVWMCFVMMWALALLATRGSSVESELAFRTDVPPYDEMTGDPSLCPPEFAARIFSTADWTFVSGEKSPEVLRLFRHERRVVALVWVHQTKTAIHRIMREHKLASSQSHDLNVATEAKLWGHYFQLVGSLQHADSRDSIGGSFARWRVGNLCGYALTQLCGRAARTRDHDGCSRFARRCALRS